MVELLWNRSRGVSELELFRFVFVVALVHVARQFAAGLPRCSMSDQSCVGRLVVPFVLDADFVGAGPVFVGHLRRSQGTIVVSFAVDGRVVAGHHHPQTPRNPNDAVKSEVGCASVVGPARTNRSGTAARSDLLFLSFVGVVGSGPIVAGHPDPLVDWSRKRSTTADSNCDAISVSWIASRFLFGAAAVATVWRKVPIPRWLNEPWMIVFLADKSTFEDP